MEIVLNSYHGYVTSRPFGGMVIPVPAQNSCIREYILKKGGSYVLPPLESYYQGCYHQLFGLLRGIPENATIIMYSLSMLPLNNSIKINNIKNISIQKKIRYAFVLENFECTLIEDRFEDESSSYSLARLQANISDVRRYFL
jgi:sporadic carbohydrate cluster protein (TIGR04323 family)